MYFVCQHQVEPWFSLNELELCAELHSSRAGIDQLNTDWDVPCWYTFVMCVYCICLHRLWLRSHLDACVGRLLLGASAPHPALQGLLRPAALLAGVVEGRGIVPLALSA